jgi:glycosyltransferase 2 family protein
MASKTRSWLSFIAKVAVAVGLITYMVRGGHLDLKVLWDLLTPKNIAIAMILTGLSTVSAAWRWIFLLRARGFYIPFAYGLRLYLIGMFFNFALPGAVSGDLVRGFYLVQDYPDRKMDSVLSILIDRVLGLYSFFILSLVAVLWDFDFVVHHEQIRWLGIMCALVFLGLTVLFTIGFSRRLSKHTRFDALVRMVPRLHDLMTGFQRFGEDRRIIALSVIASIVAQLFCMAFFYYLAQILDETAITWSAIMFAVPMGFLVTAVPISPAGVGVGQVAFLYLFRTYVNQPTQFGATSITAFQVALAAWAVVGAACYLFRRKPHELDNMQSTMEPAES